MIDYVNELKPEDYIRLRKAVGFKQISLNQAQQGLAHTTYLVAAVEENKVVGMARVLFDYGYTAYISDVIVLPECQGKGIGNGLMQHIFKFLEDNSTEGEYMMYNLVAAKGKEEFYEKFGFLRRPNENAGSGMTKNIN